MIKSFRTREELKIYRRIFSRKLPIEIQNRALEKFHLLDAITNTNELRIPKSNRLEVLVGDRNGQYSIRINKKWRICFDWLAGNIYNLEITDYH